MKGKRILSISIAAALLLMNTASPAFAVENVKEEAGKSSVSKALYPEVIQTAKNDSKAKTNVSTTAAQPYTLTADDVNLERCRENDNDSNTPYIDAVRIVGLKGDASLEKYKNIVIPETLPFDKPVLDDKGHEKHDNNGNVITEKVEMSVIKWYASFENNSNLEKVTLPKKLRAIGAKCFANCQNLSEVVVPEDSDLEEIGLGAFYKTAISQFYIPAGVEVLTDGAAAWGCNGIFEECKNLKTVTFAENSKLRIVGMRTFMKSGLTSINLPDTVEEIHEGAFTECPLEELALPDTLTNIPQNGFANCTTLKKVKFGSGLTSIGGGAFENTAIEELVIPDTVTFIGRGAFNNIAALRSVTIGKGIKELGGCADLNDPNCGSIFQNDVNIETLVFNEGLEKIGDDAFRQSQKIETLVIPSTVKHIGRFAFGGGGGIYALSKLTFAENSQLENIFYAAFSFCSIKHLKLPIAKEPFLIADHAFEGNKELIDVDLGNCRALGTTLKDNYYHDGGKAFCGCGSLRSVEFGDSLEQIGYNAFHLCGRLMGPIVFPDTLRIIGDSAFNGCTALDDVTFNEGLERIGYDETWCGNSFSGCDLHEIILPDSVKEVGNYCFRGNLHVGKIKFSANMTVIPDGFLDNYDQSVAAYAAGKGSHTNVGDHGTMKTLTIPDNIKEIGYDAFDGCLDLEYLDLGKVEYIGKGAFSCHDLLLGELGMEHASLKTVVMSPNLKEIGTRPPHTEYNGDRGDVGNTGSAYAGVFDGQGDFEGLVFPNTLEKVGKYAFVGCPAVKEFTMTENLKLIDDHAFDGCANLKKVTFADSAETKFGEEVFKYCTSLTEADIPSWLEVVPVGMFSGCRKLAKVTIPEGIDEILNNAFSDTALTNVELPESCLYINDGVFQNAPAKSVKFGSKTQSIGANAFVKDTNIDLMKWVYIPESVKSVGERAFGYYKDSKLNYEELCKEAERLGTDVQYLMSPTIANHDFVLYGGRAAKRYAEENGMIYGGTEVINPPADDPTTSNEPDTYGDLDGDGDITSADSLLILRASVMLEDFSETKNKLADVDGDGRITSADALEVLRYSVKLPTTGNIGEKLK